MYVYISIFGGGFSTRRSVKKPWLRTSTFFFQILWLDPNTSNELIRENLTIIQADQVWTGRFLWIMVSSRGPLSSIG